MRLWWESSYNFWWDCDQDCPHRSWQAHLLPPFGVIEYLLFGSCGSCTRWSSCLDFLWHGRWRRDHIPLWRHGRTCPSCTCASPWNCCPHIQSFHYSEPAVLRRDTPAPACSTSWWSYRKWSCPSARPGREGPEKRNICFISGSALSLFSQHRWSCVPLVMGWCSIGWDWCHLCLLGSARGLRRQDLRWGKCRKWSCLWVFCLSCCLLWVSRWFLSSHGTRELRQDALSLQLRCISYPPQTASALNHSQTANYRQKFATFRLGPSLSLWSAFPLVFLKVYWWWCFYEDKYRWVRQSFLIWKWETVHYPHWTRGNKRQSSVFNWTKIGAWRSTPSRYLHIPELKNSYDRV